MQLRLVEGKELLSAQRRLEGGRMFHSQVPHPVKPTQEPSALGCLACVLTRLQGPGRQRRAAAPPPVNPHPFCLSHPVDKWVFPFLKLPFEHCCVLGWGWGEREAKARHPCRWVACHVRGFLRAELALSLLAAVLTNSSLQCFPDRGLIPAEHWLTP